MISPAIRAGLAIAAGEAAARHAPMAIWRAVGSIESAPSASMSSTPGSRSSRSGRAMWVARVTTLRRRSPARFGRSSDPDTSGDRPRSGHSAE